MITSPANNRTAPNEAFVSVQYLRALAALLVVYYHATEQFAGFEHALPRDIGAAGVDLFFVISGFIMVSITFARPMPAYPFLVRRWLRIWPIYAVFTVVTASAILLVPTAFRDSAFTTKHFLLSLLFIVHPDPLNASTVSPLMKVGWTLDYEMFFYALFALCLGIGGRYRVALLGAILSGFALVGQIWHPNVVVAFYADPIVLEFLFGAIIGIALRGDRCRGLSRPVLLGIMAVGAVLACTLPPELHRTLRFGIGAAFVLFGAIAYERNFGVPKFRLPHLVGDSSYSLYLSHLFVVVTLRHAWPAFGLPLSGPVSTLAFVALSIAGAVALGIASFSMVERPLVAWSHRLVAALRGPIALPTKHPLVGAR